MRQKIVLPMIITFFMGGCGENSGIEKSTQRKGVEESPKIEIVENKNARAIKVETKKIESNSTFYKGMTNGLVHSYDPNSQPANKDSAVRMKPRTIIDANLHIRSPYEKIQIGILVSKLSKEFIVKCSACHNDYANGVIGPSLLGKSSDEIFNKIIAFKSGKKENVFMSGLIDRMDERSIRKLADEISEFNEKIKNIRRGS